MAKPDVWMPLYIGDYLSDTMHLTTEQHGAYLLLIMAYWKNGGPLPGSDPQLASICRMPVDAWSIAKAVLVEFFEVSDDGKWVSKRVEMEMRSAGEKKLQATNRAHKAAAARWGKVNDDATSIPQAMPEYMLEECPSPSPSPIKIKSECDQQADTRKSIPYEEIFEAYAEKLPMLPQLKLKDEARKRAIKSIWGLSEKFKSADFFERYFGHVSESDFLMGRCSKGFKGCCFDWLMKPANFKKIIEGNYHNDA